MEIKTKFNVGDKVFYAENGIITQYSIVGIKVKIFDNPNAEPLIEYQLASDLWVTENKVHAKVEDIYVKYRN